MMKIALFGKNISENTFPYIQELIETLHSLQSMIFIHHSFYEKLENCITFPTDIKLFSTQAEIEHQVDFLFSIGGDGTFLDSVGLVGNSGIPVAGINIGRLGFLSGISKDNIVPALKAVQQGDFQLEKRSLLLLDSPQNLFAPVNYALNEITVYKQNVMSMLTIKTWINGHFLNAYWADGLIIATPTGSTAYSLSCTGPILTPDSENFLITPISSHNLTVRPIVVRDDSIIRIAVGAKSDHFLVSLDSRIESADQTTELHIRKAPFQINLLILKDKNFFQTIREKLNWGLDNRN
ncbi:MAG: NAD kinase [Bacteroidetes bacterium]|nr:NAD kinase [Bacteroidota bacterium]